MVEFPKKIEPKFVDNHSMKDPLFSKGNHSGSGDNVNVGHKPHVYIKKRPNLPPIRTVASTSSSQSKSPLSPSTRNRSHSLHMDHMYNNIHNQISSPRSNDEIINSLNSYMDKRVFVRDVSAHLKNLNDLDSAKSVHAFVCRNVPNELLLVSNYIERSMKMNETMNKLDIHSVVCEFLRNQIDNTFKVNIRKNDRERDELWQYLFGILIRCTMVGSLDFQRFCTNDDIHRRQQIIEKLGFPALWKVIRKRCQKSRQEMEKDGLLHAALLLLLRLTISTVNLEYKAEYSHDYYNIGQNGVDGAIIFSKHIEQKEDKKKFWKVIDRLLFCHHTRVLTLYTLYNIALFRRSITSIIGHMSLFFTLGRLMMDTSKEPILGAKDALLSTAIIESPKDVLEGIAVGCPIYVISRGIASCGQSAYDRYFERLVWDTTFLNRILEFAEHADLLSRSHIARVLYSVAFRTSLKSQANRIKFSTLLIDNHEGFSNIISQSCSQDTEVKVHSLLLLLSTAGYCESKYHMILLDFFHKNYDRITKRQKESKMSQQEQNRVDNFIALERLNYFKTLQHHSESASQELDQELERKQAEYQELKKEHDRNRSAMAWYHVGMLLPLTIAGYMGYVLMKHRNQLSSV